MKELSSEQWARVDALFDEALDRPEGERAAFLRTRCGDDTVLLDLVTSLLESEPEAINIVGESAAEMAGAMLRDISESRDSAIAHPDTSPYRIVDTLGRGGMGTVYLAERADGTFEKRVALKLVKRGMDTDEVLRRFRYERQILAGLDHPNIARILDAGAADDGRPFFAMEFCDGKSITAFADANGLSIDERLELFEQVCDAVAYAHRHLVVHRDLKPGNILVAKSTDGTPVVKLLDFGIARLLDGDEDHNITQAGQRILTPAYAAPEQIRGDAATTAADVYALGVILHELLIGTRPDSPLKRPSTLATEAVTTEDALTARGISRDRLRRELRSDLDAIVINALQEDPQLRYATAEALRDDLQRRRVGLPLKAANVTLGYRFKKFVARHRWGVTVALIATIALCSFVIALDQQRRQTILERDNLQASEAFLRNLFDSADPYSTDTARPDTLRAVHLLNRGVERARVTFQDKPLLLANTLQTVGNVYTSLGLFGTADTLLSEVIATRRSLGETDSGVLADNLHDLASVRSSLGKYEEAERLYLEALDIQETVHGSESVQYARTLANLGWNQSKHGKQVDAEQSTARALAIQRRLFGDKNLDVASTMTSMARMSASLGKPADAEVVYREALAIRRELLPPNHLIIAESLDNLGIALQDQGKLDEAEASVREALSIRETVLGDMHSSVADTRYNLAVIVRNKGNFQEALELLAKVATANKKNLGPDHPYVGYNLLALGVTQSQMGDNQASLESYKAANEVLSRTLPKTHGAILEALSGEGYQYIRLGQPKRGEPLIRDVYNIRLETEGPTSWRTGISQSVLGQALMEQGNYADAEPHLIQGYERVRDASGPQQSTLQRLIAFYSKLSDSEKVQYYQNLLDAL